MINLSENEIVQLVINLEAAIEDLRQAAFESDDSTPLISTGANIGLALQKVEDAKRFLVDKTLEKTKPKQSASDPSATTDEKQKLTNVDPWIEPQSKEDYLYKLINKKLTQHSQQ